MMARAAGSWIWERSRSSSTGDNLYDTGQSLRGIIPQEWQMVNRQAPLPIEMIQITNNIVEDLKKVLRIGENKKIVKCPRCLKEMEQGYLKHHMYVIHAIDYRTKDEITMEDLLFGAGTNISKLPWIILEPGENSFERIMQFFRELQAVNYHIEYDLQRLRDVYGLGPSEIYIGLHEFNGYIVFYFSGLHKAVLECPVTGNAVYII